MPEPAWQSVWKPELEIGTDDVSLCDGCDGIDSDGCPTCGGYRLVHGYGPGGIGYPVEVEEAPHASRCAWCKAWASKADRLRADAGARITHGICATCLHAMEAL